VTGGETRTDGVRLLTPCGSRLQYVRRLLDERFDLLLTVDWRNSYRSLTVALHRVPLVVWVQDPRTPYDVRRVGSLSMPGVDALPQGVDPLDCTSLRSVHRVAELTRRPIMLAGHARYLEEKLEGTYGFRPERYHFLPDPVRVPVVRRQESATPMVLFLGRTDPIKRPWLFFELARRMPEIDFQVLGQAHFAGPGIWWADRTPPNLRLRGHVGEDTKFDLLRQAWAVVNTSIHEALPISYLEALACEVPIVAMQNPDEVVSRFGEYAGRWEGDGTAGLDHLERSLRRLLADDRLRRDRGSAGRAWVLRTHTESRFTDGLRELMTPMVDARRQSRSLRSRAASVGRRRATNV
jgi:glycosyltransferase involved in cell wall biosynthesis